MLERALDPSLRQLLDAADTVHLLAVGKAAPFMAAAWSTRARKPLTSGLVVGTHCPVELPRPLRWLPAAHPVPDDRSVRAGLEALNLAASLRPSDLLVVLLSGGASSLLAVPVSAMSLADKQAAVTGLLRTGADIGALNVVRKHLSRVKGGRLAAANAGRTLTLAVSDVIGDDPAVIGSGPTTADPSTFDQAWETLAAFGGPEAFPPAVVAFLERGCSGLEEETPKPGAAELARVETRIIGSRLAAMDGARAAAARLGYDVRLDLVPVVGEARVAAEAFARRIASMAGGTGQPRCVISSGETTVHVAGAGRGGRNQEFALAAARAMSSRRHLTFSLLSGGTDGIDGPTDAAGAVVDDETVERAGRAGLDPQRALDDNDTYPFFDALGDLVRTGPTDTNVGDIQICLVAPINPSTPMG